MTPTGSNNTHCNAPSLDIRDWHHNRCFRITFPDDETHDLAQRRAIRIADTAVGTRVVMPAVHMSVACHGIAVHKTGHQSTTSSLHPTIQMTRYITQSAAGTAH